MAANFSNFIDVVNGSLSKAFDIKDASTTLTFIGKDFTVDSSKLLEGVKQLISLLEKYMEGVAEMVHENNIDVVSVDENKETPCKMDVSQSPRTQTMSLNTKTVGTQTSVHDLKPKSDASRISSDEKDKTLVDKNLVQIKASKAEIDRRISAFIEQKQQEVDDFNRREFCAVNSLTDSESSCARADSVFITRADGKSHIKVSRVVNLFGPQTSIPSVDSTTPTSTESGSQASQGLEERLSNMENHLKINKGSDIDNTDVYSRLKCLEERILYLESLSPEYFNYFPSRRKRAHLDSNPTTTTFSPEQDMTLSEIDQKIHNLQETLHRKSSWNAF